MSGFFLDLDHFSRSKKRFFFSVTTQWLNACTWELASRNFLDGLSVTIKAFSQLCKAQNGNQEGPLLYRAAHFWVIQNNYILRHVFQNTSFKISLNYQKQICKAQNGIQEGTLMYGAVRFWVIQNEHWLPNKFIKHKMATKRVHYCTRQPNLSDSKKNHRLPNKFVKHIMATKRVHYCTG